MKIHPTAVVHPKANLADDLEVGPYSIIDENVTIGSHNKIGAFCCLEGWTVLGKNNRIFTGAVIGSIPQDLKFKGEKTYLKIGDNNIIREYVTINRGTQAKGETVIGNNNLLMAYSHIAHDCIIGNDTIIANVGTLAGHVTIEDMAIVGGLVAIHQFVRVGTLSIIGGCSKVVQDIPPYSTCDGHPTKVYGLNAVGLRRAGISSEVLTNLKSAFKILFNSGLSTSHALERIEKEIPKSPEVLHLIKFVRSSERGVCK
jgi:UDP-N-acetylglucosamine acyltransferase